MGQTFTTVRNPDSSEVADQVCGKQKSMGYLDHLKSLHAKIG